MTSIGDAWKRAHHPAASPAPRARGRGRDRRHGGLFRAPYEGAVQSRFTEDWTVGSFMPRELTTTYLTILRQRSRDLARHSPPFIAAIQTIVDNVIGAGIRITPTAHSDDLGEELDVPLNKQLARLWQDWRCEADLDRRESYAMLLRTVMQEYVEAGEVFLKENIGRRTRTGALPLTLEVIPAERVDHTLERLENTRDLTATGNAIRHGIEFNRDGERVAYWITKLGRWGDLSTERERVTADRVHHVYHRSRAAQERGIPWLYGATVLCHDLDDLVDTELTSAQVAACLTAFIQREQAGHFGTNQERDKDDDRPVERFAPGAIVDLKPGEKIETVDPNRPSGAFDPFATFLLRSLARVLGISYESLSGDYRKVNFASGRLGHLVERKTYRRLQEILVQLEVRPTWRAFVRTAVVADRVTGVSLIDYVENWRRFTRADYGTSGWEHHDPLKEITAAAVRILSGLSTLEEEAGGLGRDWETLLVQRAKEIQRMEELGIPMVVTVGGAQSQNGQRGTTPTSPASQGNSSGNGQNGKQRPAATPRGGRLAGILEPEHAVHD